MYLVKLAFAITAVLIFSRAACQEQRGQSGAKGDEGQQGVCNCNEQFEELNAVKAELAAIKAWKVAVAVYFECTFNPCQNGGTCEENGADKYTCTCPPQYTGDDCSQEKYVFLKSSQGNFQQAKAACAALDGNYHLAYIKSSGVQQEIDNRVRSMMDGIYGSFVYLWLGGTYQPGSGGRSVRWLDGTTTTIPAADWHPGQVSRSDYPYPSSISTHLLINVERDATDKFKGIWNHPPSYSAGYPLCESP